jgi:hypothetical protein
MATSSDNFYQLMIDLKGLIDLANLYLLGGDTETLEVDGEVKSSIAKVLAEKLSADAETFSTFMTDSNSAVDNTISQVIADIDSKWSAIQALVDTSLVYETKSAMDAVTPIADENQNYPLAKVWRDTEANNGIYGYSGTAWVKSDYDPLTSANIYTDEAYQRIIKTILGVSSNQNLASKSEISTNSETGIPARFNCYDDQTFNGMFVSLRLIDVTGADYPTSASDALVFSTALRVQVFDESSTLVLTKNLINLSRTDIWYFATDTVIASTEVKVYATPIDGVNFTFTECQIINGNIPAFPERELRTAAIASAKAEAVSESATYADSVAASAKSEAISSSNAYTDEALTSKTDETNVLLALLGRYGVSKNVLPKITATSTGADTNQALISVTPSSPLSCNGVFVSAQILLEDADGYPEDNTDTTYFSYAPRVQIYSDGWYSFMMKRLGDSDVWYIQNTSKVLTNITLVKMEVRGQDGVVITLDNAQVTLDGSYANPEIDARNTAIELAKTQVYEALITTDSQSDTNENLLSVTEKQAVKTTSDYTYIWITESINQILTKMSVAVQLIVNAGDYPESANDVGLKAEVFEDGVLITTKYLSRVGNTNIWYCLDVDVAAPTTAHTSVKIAVDLPTIGDDYELKNAVFMDGGFPLDLFGDIDTALALGQQGIDDAESKSNNALTQSKSYTDAKFASTPSAKPRTALEALALAESRRLDFVMLGDSNQAMDGGGFSLGLLKALRDAYGIYATGVGQNVSYLQNIAFGDHTGAPDEVEAIWSEYGVKPYNYVADGDTFSSSSNGCSVQKDYFDVNANLRAHFCWISLDNGSGSFVPGIRYGESPWTTLLVGDYISTNTGEYAKQYTTLDLSAATRDVALEAKFYVPLQTEITGPFAGAFARVENLDKHNGVSVHTLYASGGQSLWDMASTLLLYPDHQLANLFSEYRRLQIADGYDPIVVFYINSGLNDQNETSTPSWGWRKSTMPASAEAYIDNLDFITKRISDIWQKNKWPIDELFFLFVPSHPYSTPDDSDLLAYRMAAFSYAQNRVNCSMVDFSNLISHDEMFEHEYYRSENTDFYHLIEAGYADLAARIVSLVQARE